MSDSILVLRPKKVGTTSQEEMKLLAQNIKEKKMQFDLSRKFIVSLEEELLKCYEHERVLLQEIIDYYDNKIFYVKNSKNNVSQELNDYEMLREFYDQKIKEIEGKKKLLVQKHKDIKGMDFMSKLGYVMKCMRLSF